MLKMIKKPDVLSVLAILLIACLIFAKIFTKGLYPIPADLLVSFYFPWYSGSWEGYNPWTTHKEMLGADAVRQIYLWKEFAASQFKDGQIPLWNPYTFSGQPLMANFQASSFYPLNIFYFLTDPKWAWILLIISQPFLGGMFMFLLIRSFGCSRLPSLFGATSFVFSSYFITWMENGNITHSYLWLPLAFWAINQYFAKLRFRYLLILIAALALSILAGHPQTAIYIYMATFAYWIFKSWPNIAKIAPYVFAVASSFLVASIQIIPTYSFYKLSPISLPFSRDVFDRSILPIKNLITFFASDFFGHPASNNFWSQSYGDFTPYLGVIPLVFALWAIWRLWRQSFVKFAAAASLFFIVASTNGPITWAIKTLRIPVLDSTTPSRFIAIAIFLLAILAAFGFGDFLKNFKDSKIMRKFFQFLLPIGVIYLLLWAFAVLGQFFLEAQDTWQINLAVTRRNLILPTAMFLFLPISVLTVRVLESKLPIKRYGQTLLIIGIFMAVLLGGLYYSNKFLPVAPKKFIFPEHPLFDWLKQNAGLNRFYGGGTTHIDFNFPTHYQIFGAEGYDTLRLKRYAELLASSFTGQVPDSYLRSDGVFPVEENGYRRRLFDLMGVKYILDKDDFYGEHPQPYFNAIPGDDAKGIWLREKFQIHERKNPLPRVFLTTKYYLAASDQEIIKKIYDPNFNLETILLEEEPDIPVGDITADVTIAKIEQYSPDKTIFSTDLSYNSILFVSDAHDPDWQVEIDNRPAKLLRAHYAFRAVVVPAGSHQVTFQYQPPSFARGLKVSALSIIGLILLSVYFVKIKKF